MGERLECPACESETSTVLIRFRDGEPCPYCGLSAAAMAEIFDARKRGADKALMTKYTEAVKRADKAEREVSHLRSKLSRIEQALKDDEETA